jgi:hypothetical protein
MSKDTVAVVHAVKTDVSVVGRDCEYVFGFAA